MGPRIRDEGADLFYHRALLSLEPGRWQVAIRGRRCVHNPFGSVHAIALCNLAELAAGLMTHAPIPSTMRRVPKGMPVD